MLGRVFWIISSNTFCTFYRFRIGKDRRRAQLFLPWLDGEYHRSMIRHRYLRNSELLFPRQIHSEAPFPHSQHTRMLEWQTACRMDWDFLLGIAWLHIDLGLG